MTATPSRSRTASSAERAGLAPDRGERLLGYLQAESESLCGFLEELAGAESPSDDPGAQDAVLGLLARRLSRLDYRIRRARGRTTGGFMLAVPRSRVRGRPFQLLIGHSDTVWPHGILDKMPIGRRGGKLYGPGVYDMKGGLASIVFALEALAALGFEPAVMPVVFINTDEEIGSVDSRRTLARFARVADRALVLEPAAGRAGKLKTQRKGVGKFTLTVRGRAAHAGTEPDRGVSAILALSQLVQQLFALNDPASGVTVNVGTIDGGLRPNVVAPESRAEVDVRVVTAEQGVEIDRRLKRLRAVDPRIKLEVSGGMEVPPMLKTERNSKLWRAARAAGREIGLALVDTLAGGGSDGNTTSLYTATLDGLGPVGAGAHADHEHVTISSLAERTALLALVMLLPPMRPAGGR